MLKKIAGLVFCVVISQLAGAIGSLATYPNLISWYAALEKSPLNPPNWVFGPVWGLLFTLMGIALWLVWEKRAEKNIKLGLTFFIIQLALNSLWSIIFFGWHQPLAAFIELIIFWAAILLTAVNFYKIRKSAGLILIPYLAWVAFAGYLTFSVWQLN